MDINQQTQSPKMTIESLKELCKPRPWLRLKNDEDYVQYLIDTNDERLQLTVQLIERIRKLQATETSPIYDDYQAPIKIRVGILDKEWNLLFNDGAAFKKDDNQNGYIMVLPKVLKVIAPDLNIAEYINNDRALIITSNN